MRNKPNSASRVAGLVLGMSVLSSVLLAAFAVHWSREAARIKSGTVERPVEIAATNVPPPMNEVAESQTVLVTNAFHWGLLESTNYAEYVRNLRSIGCPERTIADIVHAELNEDFKARERAIGSGDSFWLGGKARREAERTHQAQRHRLKEEHDAALRQLGIAPQPSVMKEAERLVILPLLHFCMGPMPDDKFEQVLFSVDRHARREEEIRLQQRRLRTVQGDEALERSGETLRNELRSILSPLEFEEMTARTAAFELIDEPYAEVAALNAWELRQIAMYKSDGGERFQFMDLFEKTKSSPEQERRFTNNVARLLGPQRFSAFLLASDGDFKSDLSFTRAYELPMRTAIEIHNVRQLAVAERSRIRADAQLDEAMRLERMREVEVEIQNGALKILGPSAFQQYLGQGGSWLTNASRL